MKEEKVRGWSRVEASARELMIHGWRESRDDSQQMR